MEKRETGISPKLLCLIATGFAFLSKERSYIPKIEELATPFKWLTNVPAWAGIWIFLILSGYVVGRGFSTGRHSLYDGKNLKVQGFARFYLERFIKVAPLYYLYCIFFEVFSGNYLFWKNKAQMIKMLTFTFNGLGSVSGLSHLWIVSLVMQLYLVMPFVSLLILLLKKKKVPLMLLYGLAIVVGWIVRLTIVNRGYDWYTRCYVGFFPNLDLVVIGMLVAEMRTSFSLELKRPTLCKWLAVVLFVGLTVYNSYMLNDKTFTQLKICRCILPSAYAATCGLLLLLSGSGKTLKTTSFGKRIVDWFSAHAYTSYIFYSAVFYYLNETLVQKPEFAAAGVGRQYVAFFLRGLLLTLLFAVPFDWVGKKIVERYKMVERKVFR